MNPTMRNVLAVVAGFVFGSVVNMGFVNFGMSMVPRRNLSDRQRSRTLAGAAAAARLGVSQHFRLAMVIGVLFLCGGLAMVFMVPGAPAWFIALDLVAAYLPMAWLGYKLAATRIKA